MGGSFLERLLLFFSHCSNILFSVRRLVLVFGSSFEFIIRKASTLYSVGAGGSEYAVHPLYRRGQASLHNKL